MCLWLRTEYITEIITYLLIKWLYMYIEWTGQYKKNILQSCTELFSSKCSMENNIYFTNSYSVFLRSQRASEQILPTRVRTAAAFDPQALLGGGGDAGEGGQAEAGVHAGTLRVHWINCHDMGQSYTLPGSPPWVPFSQQSAFTKASS
jgi:hypothetical protein